MGEHAAPDATERCCTMRAEAQRCMEASAPRSPLVHLMSGIDGAHLFVADASRLFDVPAGLVEQLRAAVATGRVEILLARLGLTGAPRIDDTPLAPGPVHALSLAVAQKCNLACTYCYAQQGEFGTAPANMPLAVAERAVDFLVDGAAPGNSINLAFLGGEPLANREVLRAATRRAADRAARRGIPITFSITTNGTLITAEDAAFLAEHRFAVTISLDGPREVHDALRPFKKGGGTFDRIMRNLSALLARQVEMQVSARVTVTPHNLALRGTLDELIALGFHSVGFSPVLSSPTGCGEMQPADLEIMLGEMIDCGREFERRTRAGVRYPFANMLNAMREIGRGTHRPYACGAGAGYLGVSADGALAACHRFVGDAQGQMGSLTTGVDIERQVIWLTERHVHRQEPCRRCWARYLCGGGCHHEVIRRGRPACDYIRGWLHYCLEAYLRLSARPSPTVAPWSAHA